MSANASVLIVDDEPGVRESLRAILAGECDVHTAASGADALALIGSIPVDVVTLDLRMPGIDGIGVLKRIKELDQDIEALIISGHSPFDAALAGLRLRAFDYVSKPFDIQHVRALVRRAVAQRQALRRLRAERQAVVGSLSEAFRRPIDVILGESEAAGGTADSLTTEQRAALDRIRGNSAALARYIDGIFLLFELKTGRRRVLRDVVHFGNVLDGVAGRYRGRADAKKLAFAIDYPQDTVLETDAALLECLLDHLVDNAVRFTTKGRVGVVVRAEGETGCFALTVSDTGVGLPAAELETICDGRSGLCGPADHGAAGVALGLYTVAIISRHLGGRLAVVSGAESGTSISVSLPVRIDTANEACGG